MKIYKSIYNFDEIKPLIPWIKRITINTCQNYLRDNKNKLTSSNPSVCSEIDIAYLVTSAPSVEEEIEYFDTKKILERAIKQLPSDIKSVVILRHIEGLSYKEISEFVYMPIGTVKTYLFRGRKMIKDILINEGIWEV